MTSPNLTPNPPDDGPLEGPAHFAAAAEAFIKTLTVPLSAHHVAKALSALAHRELLVSRAEYDRRCDQYTGALADVDSDLDALLARIRKDGV